MRWVLLLFVVVPLVELYLLLQIASLIDFWPTVGLVVVTGIIGGTLAKLEGLRVLRAWREAFQTMTPPEQGVLDGVLVLAGGALLVTPGVLTDIVGLLMLIPPTRRFIARRVRGLVDRAIETGRVQVVTSSTVSGGPFAPPPDAHARRPNVIRSSSEVVDTTGEAVDD